MKQFSLEEYLENPNRKVVTRDGKDVRILCTDRKGKGYRNVVTLVTVPTGSGTYESINTYWEDGKESKSRCAHIDDLFFAPTKHEGWINLYRGGNGSYPGIAIYATKKEAIADPYLVDKYITSVKIEWED